MKQSIYFRLYGKLKNSCKCFKKFFGITVSHQTIEKWLFINENILEFDLGRCSGLCLRCRIDKNQCGMKISAQIR